MDTDANIDTNTTIQLINPTTDYGIDPSLYTFLKTSKTTIKTIKDRYKYKLEYVPIFNDIINNLKSKTIIRKVNSISFEYDYSIEFSVIITIIKGSMSRTVTISLRDNTKKVTEIAVINHKGFILVEDGQKYEYIVA